MGRREQLCLAGHHGRRNPGLTSSPSSLPTFPAAFLAGDTRRGTGTGSGTSQTFPEMFLSGFFFWILELPNGASGQNPPPLGVLSLGQTGSCWFDWNSLCLEEPLELGTHPRKNWIPGWILASQKNQKGAAPALGCRWWSPNSDPAQNSLKNKSLSLGKEHLEFYPQGKSAFLNIPIILTGQSVEEENKTSKD